MSLLCERVRGTPKGKHNMKLVLVRLTRPSSGRCRAIVDVLPVQIRIDSISSVSKIGFKPPSGIMYGESFPCDQMSPSGSSVWTVCKNAVNLVLFDAFGSQCGIRIDGASR
jgi:hypothetical protein